MNESLNVLLSIKLNITTSFSGGDFTALNQPILIELNLIHKYLKSRSVEAVHSKLKVRKRKIGIHINK